MTDVLLAEDDVAIAEPLARALGREGYGCQVVTDGAQALEYAQDSRYELLILDLGLPEIDGLEVCRRIRTTRPGLAVPDAHRPHRRGRLRRRSRRRRRRLRGQTVPAR